MPDWRRWLIYTHRWLGIAGSRAVLQPGMTVAYEPMVVIEGLGTGVIEDTLLITEDGYRLLTHAPRNN